MIEGVKHSQYCGMRTTVVVLLIMMPSSKESSAIISTGYS
jgi:hypothetical protein